MPLAPLPPCGVLLTHKPVGLTSATVVNRVKAAFRQVGTRCKVGHAGTLDQLAEGLLLVLVGGATRWFDQLAKHDKEYEADIRLDAFSATDDAEGPMTPVAVEAPPSQEQLQQALVPMTGVILQRPPAFSRVHVAGRRADDVARAAQAAGEQTQRPPARPVSVFDLAVRRYAFPQLQLMVRCGSGTYVRSLARDLGERLGTGGRLDGLVRTRIGPFRLDQAVRVDKDRRITPEEAEAWLTRLSPLI